MILVGELINSSRKRIAEAIESQDEKTIQKIAAEQTEAGAHYIDVNAGIFLDREPEYLKWLVQTVQEVTDKPCAIDSPSTEAIISALEIHAGIPMINSISLEKRALRQPASHHRRHQFKNNRPVHERRWYAGNR